MTHTRRNVIKGLVAAGPVTALSSRRSAHAQSKPILVGSIGDLTGVSAGLARSEVNGRQIAVDHINAEGGLLGRKVELLIRDSQTKPNLGAAHARELITSDKVDFLVGPTSSAVAPAVSNVAKQYKKLMVASTPNSPRLTINLFHRYIFNVSPSGIMEARAIADTIGAKYKKIGFIGADFEAAHQGLRYFKERLAAHNSTATITTEQWPKLGESDYAPYITALMGSDPDVVYSYLFGADLVGFFKQASLYGLPQKAPIAGLTFVVDLVALGKDMPDGMYGLMRAPFFAIGNDAMTAFSTEYQKRFNTVVDDNAALAYEAISIVFEAIKKSGSTDSDALVDAMESNTFAGLTGPLKFRALDHQCNVPMFVGITTTSDKYPFKILKDVRAIPAGEIWPTPPEIEADRNKT